MTTIKSVTEEKEKKNKKLKSLIGFLSANKINNYNRGKKKCLVFMCARSLQ